MPIDISSNLRAKTGDVHEMEDILDHEWAGTTRRNLKYLVKWRGFSVEEGEWLSGKELKNIKETVDDYHRRKGLEPVNWTLSRREMKEQYGNVRKITLRAVCLFVLYQSYKPESPVQWHFQLDSLYLAGISLAPLFCSIDQVAYLTLLCCECTTGCCTVALRAAGLRK